ncbi:hypothetical protein C7999DRAFT_32477 [Corynascus novoguineensis]|uniref:Uncharacterized protein n=1 Tax=Corynascus novoguineensis TaxID=1126955 RepID=A0AAN7CSH6_9PEZI|nr:hypothetical protein C7999DRAFT_32477 [Corynascus novoguineensis]
MNYTRGPVPGGHGPSVRSHKASASVPEGQFDPDELTRRLYLVLAEQKAHEERKRRSRGHTWHTRHREARQRHDEPPADLTTELRRTETAKYKPAGAVRAPDAPPKAYQHVPQEAAKQFTRTTTVDNMRDSSLIHKLSKHALKFHLEGPGGRPDAAADPAELTRALQQTQIQRDMLLDRNQFQRTRALEEAARLDYHQQNRQHPARKQQHTLEAELARILSVGGGHHHQQTHYNKQQQQQSTSTAAWGRNSAGNVADHLSTSPSSPSATDEHAGGGWGGGRRRSLLAAAAAPDTLVMDTLLEDVPPAPPLQPAADRARVDWTQSDEPAPPPITHVNNNNSSRSSRHADGNPSANINRDDNHNNDKYNNNNNTSRNSAGPRLLLLSPLLRKADSFWMLKGRRGSRDSSGSGGKAVGGDGITEHAAGEAVGQSLPTTPTTPTTPSRMGKGFFGRFKR